LAGEILSDGTVAASALSERLRPLRRAHTLQDYFVYWIPVDSVPLRSAQKAWLREFMDRLLDYLQPECGLTAQVFLQYKTIHPHLMEDFTKHALEFVPLMGFARKPGVALPPIPTLEDLQPLINREKAFDLNDYIGDFCYWFVVPDAPLQRDLFFGHGGMTFMFTPPNGATPATPVPIPTGIRNHTTFKPLFEKVDPNRVVATGRALQQPWLGKSLELYRGDLDPSPQLRGVPFIIPLLRSSDFIHSSIERQKLATLCEFYITESPEDGGILFASPTDHEGKLLAILEEMRSNKYLYPEMAQ